MIERIGTHLGESHLMFHLEVKLNGTWLIDCGSNCDVDERVTWVEDEVSFAKVFRTDIGHTDDYVADCESWWCGGCLSPWRLFWTEEFNCLNGFREDLTEVCTRFFMWYGCMLKKRSLVCFVTWSNPTIALGEKLFLSYMEPDMLKQQRLGGNPVFANEPACGIWSSSKKGR